MNNCNQWIQQPMCGEPLLDSLTITELLRACSDELFYSVSAKVLGDFYLLSQNPPRVRTI